MAGPYTKITQIDNQQGTAVFYRDRVLFAAAIPACLSVDGDCIAALGDGDKCQINLTPGTHTVKVRGGLGTVSDKMTINIDSDKVSYVHVYINPTAVLLMYLPVIGWVTVPEFLLEEGNLNA